MSERRGSSNTTDWDKERVTYLVIGLSIALTVIIAINIVSSLQPAFAMRVGRVLVDYQASIEVGQGGPRWWAFQNFMWVAFFTGMADIFYRSQSVKQEGAEIDLAYLPEDDRSLLTAAELPAIFKKVRTADRHLFLPRLIGRIVVQFQKSNSIDQANSLLNSSLDLYLHELDLRYTVIRYTNWIIPTFGFLGTVYGIADALQYAGTPGNDPTTLLAETTLKLGTAFYTTGVALGMSAILVLGMNLVQAAEERVLNRCGQYCLDNLINKLFERKI